MRVFKVQDGSSWVARVEQVGAAAPEERRVGWEAILFENPTARAAARLVYRPSGWLGSASLDELVAALQEGDAVRARWEPQR